MEYLEAFHNLIFPTRNLCYFCMERDYKVEKYLCPSCRGHLEVVNKNITLNSYVDEAYYSILYNRMARKIIKDFKFNGKSYLFKPLGEFLLDTLNLIDIDYDKVYFVPAHRRKEAIRGYNQSELLAKYLAERVNKPLSKGNLIKVKHTKDQSKLDRIGRMKNLGGAFRIKNKRKVENKSILLIDDIITTGYTMMECGHVLKKAGAKKVVGLGVTSGQIL
ncbi:MAG TPA: ComF family protein [Tissierellaceae bacterium]|nr:ComF family protein [Tissierellaceae bacterium]